MGLCYQRLLWGDNPDTGHVLHGLVAVYLRDKWIRLDARGNKTGVDAQFSIDEEKLAFPVRPEFGEIDYPTIYAAAHPLIVEAFDKAEFRGDVSKFFKGLDFKLPE